MNGDRFGSGWALLGLMVLLSAPVHAQSLTHLTAAPADGVVLGEIGDVDISAEGGLVVMDTQADVVHLFGADGSLVRTLGGEGQGPGEIQLSNQVEVGPDGEIMISDAQNRRLTLWSAAGTLLGSARFDALIEASPAWPHDLVWDRAGLFLKMSQFVPGEPVEVFRIPAELQGTARRVSMIPQDDDAATCLFCPMTVDGDGRLLAAVGDTVYAVVALDDAGRAVASWTRDGLPAARRGEAELNRLRSDARRVAAAEGGVAGTLSPFLSRFGPHSLDVDELGRLWTAPRVAEGENGSFDVFATDGRLLRSVTVDVPVLGFRIRGDRLAVASETAIGEPVVHLFRIEG